MSSRIKIVFLLVCVMGLALFGPSCGTERGRKPDGTTSPQDSGIIQTSPDTQTQPDPGQAQPDQVSPPDPGTPEASAPESVSTPEPTPEPVSTPDPGQGPPEQGAPEQGTPEPPPLPEQSTPEPPAPDRAPPAGANEFRFVAFGDAGTGSSKQKDVAAAIKKKCDDEAKPGGRGKCDFGIMLGDNFYDTGVKSATDPLFKTHFADMYHQLGFPFYVTIGNHDYGIEGIGGVGFGFDKLKHYMTYATTDSRFILPSSFYTFQQQHATFISLNTAELFFEYNAKAQEAFVQQAVTAAQSSTWRIAFGHHPYISNGAHGNAGTYEGIPIPIPYVSGTSLKKFFEKEICNKVDFYFCGHDHNIQLLAPKCGVQFVVSGAGAKNKAFGDKNRNPSVWQSDSKLGFVYVHIKGKTLTLQIINDQGVMEHEKVFTK